MDAKECKRVEAYRRLEAQLSDGTKRSKEDPTKAVPLTEADVRRIEAEMGVLRGRASSLGGRG